tara:strand:- start:208 stop:621 length:414 start_codon:yes stop_codon:yes gene_type:complete
MTVAALAYIEVFMSASFIQSKIKFGLAKAKDALGSDSDPVTYLERRTTTGGNSPLNPPTISIENVELVNAILDDVSRSMIDGNLIKQGDSSLTCDNEVEIKQGDTITRGSNSYVVITVIETNPTGSTLLYEPILRLR